ncbi:MAG: FAD-dependent oxidoreductase [Desulfobacteraceae bacterium]|jgi:formate dehydrogenase beta subunit
MTEICFSSWGGKVVDNRGKALQNYAPLKNVSLPEHFKQDEQIKALMGWYGIVLRSETVDVVDLSRSYMDAVRRNSCGKCTPCRLGTRLMADILARICDGKGQAPDLDTLESMAKLISETSKCHIGQAGPRPILHALAYFRDAFQAAIAEPRKIPAGAYRSRVTAPCMDACPIHLDIPSYVEYIKEGKFQESLDLIRERLPIPGVVGRVCVRPCESHCRRALLDEPISIKYLKRFVADQELEKHQSPSFQVRPSPKTGKVAIVGAGPAGVTCAYHLVRKGHQVTIYEQLDEPGGMAAVGIPDYRLPRQILRDEVSEIQKLGVTIHYNTPVGQGITLSQLEAENDAVFVGVGAQGSSNMRVEGEDEGYKGFIPGVEYLRAINDGKDPYPEGQRVVVVGGGNVAIDCVRCSFRVNKKDVNLVYRRTRKEMPAEDVEVHDAEEEGVNFHFLTTPVRVVAEKGKVVGLECIRMELGEPDASGRRRPVPVEGSEFVMPCDIAVPAIGQQVDLSLLEGLSDIEVTRWHTIVVNDVTKQTNRPKIFSAGDCETGPNALITGCAGARKAAFSIDRFINGLPLEPEEEDCFDQLFKKVKVYDGQENTGLIGGRSRYHLRMLPPESRKFTFEEVEEGYTTPEAMAEADRCLRCYSVVTVAV